MPELPDVEGFRRDWRAHAAGRRIERVRGPDPTVLRNTSTSGLGRALARRRFAEPQRWGKWLIAPTDEFPALLLHFGMTGSIAADGRGDELTPQDRIVWDLDAGWVAYRSVRKLGGVWLVRDDTEREQITGPLGPDATTLDAENVEELLAGRRGGIKAALMDQRLMAGVGNELSDEILVRSGIHPRTAVDQLDDRDVERLAAALAETLEQSVAAGRIPDDDGWLNAVRGEDGAACPRCGSPVVRGGPRGGAPPSNPRGRSQSTSMVRALGQDGSVRLVSIGLGPSAEGCQVLQRLLVVQPSDRRREKSGDGHAPARQL